MAQPQLISVMLRFHSLVPTVWSDVPLLSTRTKTTSDKGDTMIVRQRAMLVPD